MERSNIVQLGARGCSLPLAVGPLLSTHLNLRMPWASPPCLKAYYVVAEVRETRTPNLS